MYRIPELLAPAGGINQFSAAVENGADAVYIGGTRFNARMNADNFTEGAMEECIRYAHTRGAAVHVTMNTLLSDSELPEALRYAARVCELGADALIVQDPGLAWLLHSTFPEIELHLSTQGTVYNAAGVKQAAELGFSRVVLARETSLAEIEKIAAAIDTERVELEVFVHGALCMCYSGQCHLSRVIGGRSGNRGACAQPCRLGYQIYRSADGADGIGELDRSDGTGEVNRADGTGGSFFSRRTLLGSGFLLSPGDLCGIDHLKELSEAGIASLKIEGRMKSPEYVGVVTGIYRRCLDEYAETGNYTVRPEERLALAQIFSRGEFTTGYLFGNPRRELLSGELSKHQGIRIGTVRAYNAKRKTAQVSLDAPLATGDGVEIHSRTAAGETRLTGNVITYQKGNEIGYIKEPVCPGDPIYKITDKALMERARATYERKSGAERKQQRKRVITMEFYARPGETARLTAWLGKEKQKGSSTACNPPGELPDKGLMAAVYSADCAERAKTRPLDGELLRRQLEKTGDTPFALGKLCFDLGEEPVSIPVSVLNDMRRRVLAELEAKILEPASPAWRDGQGAALRPMLRAQQAAAALPELLYGADTAASGAGTADTVSAGTVTADTNTADTVDAGKAGVVRPGRVAYYLFSADEEALELAACAHHTVETGLSVPVSRFYLPYELFLRKEGRLGEKRVILNMFSLKCVLNIDMEMQGRQWGLETEKAASQQ